MNADAIALLDIYRDAEMEHRLKAQDAHEYTPADRQIHALLALDARLGQLVVLGAEIAGALVLDGPSDVPQAQGPEEP